MTGSPTAPSRSSSATIRRALVHLASGIPNTGQYYWPVEVRIPEKVYLRIEVLDEAGNKGEFQLQEAVSTTGLVPQGRIRGFRSARSYWPQFTDLE